MAPIRSLELTKGNHPDLGRPRQVILGPVDQGTGGAALGWRHPTVMPYCCIPSITSFFGTRLYPCERSRLEGEPAELLSLPSRKGKRDR